MTGGKNVLAYITTEAKRVCKASALEYLQKSTGVFNQDGMIEKQQLEAMKARIQANTGNIWHGFISLSKEESHKIDTPAKCIALVKRTFGTFFKEASFNEDNIDLMCVLHTDKPHHLHIHFVFWEKEPKYYYDGGKGYRKKGKIPTEVLERMSKRWEHCIDDNKPSLYNARDKALEGLRQLTNLIGSNRLSPPVEDIKDEIVSLAKDLPKTGRLTYGSQDMLPYRKRVDNIVQMLLDFDKQARQAHKGFYDELIKKEATKNINQQTVKDIESDYICRQGNLVLSLAKSMKPEIYERKQGKRYKRNDNNLKRSLAISRKKIDGLFSRFISSFGSESDKLSKEHANRLRQIEEEMKQEQRQEEIAAKKETAQK